MLNLREYAFDRFRLSLLDAEQKRNVGKTWEIMTVAVDKWKKDYRLLAAVWLFLFQRWLSAAECRQFELANIYGHMLELICNVTARRNLPWDDYQAFSRLTQDDPFNSRWQDALADYQ